jgi:hypothetical protein
MHGLLNVKYRVIGNDFWGFNNCHTQYTWDSCICIFYLIEQHSKFLLHTLQVLYICTLCDSTNINTIIVCCVWQVVKTPTIIFSNLVHSVYVFSEQTATCATYSINWSLFVTEMKSVYRAVRTGFLYNTHTFRLYRVKLCGQSHSNCCSSNEERKWVPLHIGL